MPTGACNRGSAGNTDMSRPLLRVGTELFMQITTEEGYRQALDEIQALAGAPADSPDERRRLELQAAAAHYAEKLHNASDSRKGKPPGSIV